jgi:type IV pilus assembly protein PilX
MSAALYKTQQGAALIVSLLVLVVLSLLSISAMNSAAMQERMSGHLRDGQLAFESADAALRDSELWLDAQVQPATPCDTVASDCDLFTTTALDALDGADGRPWWAEVDNVWWDDNGHDFIAAGTDLAATNAADPRTIIEELARVPDSLVVGVAPQGSRIYYRLTARGVGGSPWAQTVVQSTFVKQAN